MGAESVGGETDLVGGELAFPGIPGVGGVNEGSGAAGTFAGGDPMNSGKEFETEGGLEAVD